MEVGGRWRSVEVGWFGWFGGWVVKGVVGVVKGLVLPIWAPQKPARMAKAGGVVSSGA